MSAYSVELSTPGESVSLVDVESPEVESMISVVKNGAEIEAWSKFVEGILGELDWSITKY